MWVDRDGEPAGYGWAPADGKDGEGLRVWRPPVGGRARFIRKKKGAGQPCVLGWLGRAHQTV